MQANHGGSSGRNDTDGAGLNIYENAISFVIAAEHVDEDIAAAILLRELNGYSNGPLLYQIRASVIALRAARTPITVSWEKAWLS